MKTTRENPDPMLPPSHCAACGAILVNAMQIHSLEDCESVQRGIAVPQRGFQVPDHYRGPQKRA